MISKLAKIIIGKMEEKNKRPKDIAAAAEITPAYVSQWLNGKLKSDPAKDKITKIAKLLDMDPEELWQHAKTSYDGTRSKTLTQATGTLLISEVIYANPSNSDMLKEVLAKAGKKEVSRKKWQKILDIIDNED